MENNIPTLYILQRDSYVVKNAKLLQACISSFKNVYFINKRRFGDLLHLQVVGL